MNDRVERGSVTVLPSAWGDFVLVGYRDLTLGVEHVVALNTTTAAQLGIDPSRPTLVGPAGPCDAVVRVRIHSECLTGDILGSHRCDCGPQLHAALRSVSDHGGLVIYLRGHEGRGVGLLNKLAAYRLQDQGFDTVDAQTELGLPVDAREYGAAMAMLRDLGVGRVSLLTNNPVKGEALRHLGIDVVSSEQVLAGQHPANRRYLATKRDRMGHRLPVDSSGAE